VNDFVIVSVDLVFLALSQSFQRLVSS